MISETELENQARDFAQQLAVVTSAFVGREIVFDATRLGDKFAVMPRHPVVLRVGRRDLFALDVSYRCLLDHEARYLRVEESSVKVFGGAKKTGDPLFRYEYIRDSAEELPSAHLHVHAHRDALVMAMALAGVEGAPRRTLGAGHDFVQGGRMAAVHFPLGGHRFRPALEDVLQMLRTEFGVSVGQTWEEELGRARESYRRKQTATVVRECPSEAVKALVKLGYGVTPPPEGSPPDDVWLLRAF